MDKKEIINDFQNFKGKFNYRQFFMVTILFFATAADILIDYVNAGFNASIFTNASYWVKLVLTCISIILVTLSVRDFFREKELRDNGAVSKVQLQIDIAHSKLVEHNLTTKFENYVNEINAERKLKSYKAYLQFKLFKAKKDKHLKKYKNLLEEAESNIDFMPTKGGKIKVNLIKKVKFNIIRIATIFSRNKLKENDDENIEDNENRHVKELIFKKLFMLIAFSLTLSTLFFDTGEFAVAILINTFSKLFRIAMSMYLGASDGQDFVRGTLLSKMKLRLDFIQKFLEKEKIKNLTENVAI